MLAAFAAAASPSISAPGSLACRRLMIDAYPIFLIPATAAGVVAPAHAIVVSTRAKLVTPGTVSLVTLCAFSVTTSVARAQASTRRNRSCMSELLAMKRTPRMLGPGYHLVNVEPPTSHDAQNRCGRCGPCGRYRRRAPCCRVFTRAWKSDREDERPPHRRERHDGGRVGVSEDPARRRLARHAAVVRRNQARLQDLYEHTT